MKSINLLVSCVMALVFSTKAMAQEPDFLFEQPSPFTIPQEYLSTNGGPGIIPLAIPDNADSDGNCILMASEDQAWWLYETDEMHQPVAYLLSSNGSVVRSLLLGYEGQFSYLLSVVQDPNDSHACLVLGKVHDNDNHYDRPFLAKIDYNLNLLWQKEIELPESCHHCIDLFGRIIDIGGKVMGFISHFDYENPPMLSHNVYFKVNPDGELDGVLEYPNTTVMEPQCELFEYRDGSGDLGHVVREEETDEMGFRLYLLRIGNNLELLERMSIPKTVFQPSGTGMGMTMPRTAFPTTENEVIYGGNGFQIYTPGQYGSEQVIAFFRVNEDGEVEDYSSSGGNPSAVVDSLRTMLCYLKCSDLSSSEDFVFFYKIGENHGIGHDYTNCFAVEKRDFKGNTLWKRYWNRYYPEYGMKVYVPTAIAATADGGCLVAGYSYYSDINEPWPIEDFDPQTSVFLLKVFADGTLSSPEAEAYVRPYACYPNPVGDVLYLEFSPDAVPTLVELYDVQGRHVLCQRNGFGSIATKGLPAGVYTLMVTLEGGKSYSDTIIKN